MKIPLEYNAKWKEEKLNKLYDSIVFFKSSKNDRKEICQYINFYYF
jgi:hypothetical protein